MSATRLILMGLLTVAMLTPLSRVQAQDERRRAQISAATENALRSLRADVYATRITRSLTVEDFLRRTGSADEFDQGLQLARQIGGPRWIDEQTCQIKLELPGEVVSNLLIEIARTRPTRTPLPAEVLARELRGWRERVFVGTGASITFEKLERLPVQERAWEHIDDNVRQQALNAARQDAVRRALENVKPVQLAPGLTVGDALDRPQVAQRMSQWYESRPIRTVSFTENLQVDLTLGAAADEAFEQFMDAVRAAPDVQVPDDPRELQRIRAQFIEMMGEAAGHASVARPTVAVQPPAPQAVELPPQPPQWVLSPVPLDAEGTASAGAPPLKVQRAAHDQALENLRAKLGALPLSDELTLADAVRRDRRLAEAIDRAMLHARVFKVDLQPDGGRLVRVTLDPRILWDELLYAR